MPAAEEPGEQPLPVGGGDAEAGVGHAELGAVGVDAERHLHPATRLGVLHGVRDEVVDHLPHPLRIGQHDQRAGRLVDQLDPAPLRRGIRRLDALADDRGQVGRLPDHGQRALVRARGLQQVGHQAVQPPAVAGDHLELRGHVGRQVVALEQQLHVADDRGQRGPQLVGDRGDELVLDPERAHVLGDVLVGQGRAGPAAGVVLEAPCRDRQGPSGQRVATDPDAHVLELLAQAGAVRRHLLGAQLAAAGRVVHSTGLSRVPVVPAGEGQPHELGVPAVHALVGAVAVEEQQADVDGVEDRLGDATLLLDDLDARPDPLHRVGDRQRRPRGDQRDQHRPGQVGAGDAQVEQARHRQQERRGHEHHERPAATVLPPEPQRRDHGEGAGRAATGVHPREPQGHDVGHRQDADHPRRRPAPGHHRGGGTGGDDDPEPGDRPGPERER